MWCNATYVDQKYAPIKETEKLRDAIDNTARKYVTKQVSAKHEQSLGCWPAVEAGDQ